MESAIAGTALVLSVFSLWYQFRRERYAEVIVAFVEHQSPNRASSSLYLEVRNIGSAPARDVLVRFPSEPDDSRPTFYDLDSREELRVPIVLRGAPVLVGATSIIHVPTLFEVEVSWKDKRRARQVALTTMSRVPTRVMGEEGWAL